MPADASAAEAVLSRQRRIGLRVALAVATGFALNLATGVVIPFLGPVLAVQFLLLGAGPLPLSKAVVFVGLVLSSDRPSLFSTASLATTRSSCWPCSVYFISYASSCRRGDTVAL
jgi:hypothetical protein